MAGCIADVGPQYGRPVTAAAPGASWHQYGDAMDVFNVLENGEANWDRLKPYRRLAKMAPKFGLRSLGPAIGDWVHIQAPQQTSPLSVYDWEEANSVLLGLWGHLSWGNRS